MSEGFADILNRRQAESIVDGFLAETDLPADFSLSCPYLPGRPAGSAGFVVDGEIDALIYEVFMDRGFRRSGRVIYRPDCPGCRSCLPIRVLIGSFQRTRSMRRVWARNGDVRVETAAPSCTDEKHELFVRYLRSQHDDSMPADRPSFERFLYDSPVPTMELAYYAGRRLIGVSLADVGPHTLSSVYMFFDPDERRRSLGTFSVLWEIEHCRATDRPYYYLGYCVPGSRKMAYKARFQPAEVLDLSGRWRPWSVPEVD